MATPPKNYLSAVIYLLLIVIAMLLLLNTIPATLIEKYHLRPMDILSDIRKKNFVETVILDTVSTPTPPPLPLKLSDCPENITDFEDYSSEQNGMDAFFAALDSKQKARIAFFGDSFIEGDIFSGDLREELQKKYGGKGIGMVPLSSPISGFRHTIVHQHKGWKDYSLIDVSHTPPLGISGHVFIPQENAWASYSFPKKGTISDSCQKVSVFYKLTAQSGNFYYKMNGQESVQCPLLASNQIERFDILQEKIGNISLSFPDTAGLSLYGVSLEDTSGVILDNFSVRGTAGTAFSKTFSSLPRFNELIGYDLIILEYGLNIMEAEKTGYKGYEESMVKTVEQLKSFFPNASFLLLSVSDRSMRKDGEYVTMPAVPAMVALQKRICSRTGIVFWNLYEAMGGNGSMVQWADSNPPKANKDYTHLTFTGGKQLGKLLYQAFEFENIRYNEKKDYYKKNNLDQHTHPMVVDSTGSLVRK